MLKQHLYYDGNDYKLLDILNDILDRKIDHSQFKTLLTPYLRPHGIKELAATQRIRIAYAIMHLLGSLESEEASERITALRALRDEVLTTDRNSMRNNRARVLIQIVKELIRARSDRDVQLELAHDFRTAALGRTAFIRAQLKKYHLLEMPEEWNQISFDDRVHDANSKGRKSATHLIMDAWVKGIRNLRVVYYDNLDQAVAAELFASARILGITVRVGIEYRAVYRGRFIKIVWDPDGLRDDADISSFFKKEGVRQLMSEGRELQRYRTRYVEAVTERFNEVHRESILKEFSVQLPAVDFRDVARSVTGGQPSLPHLGRYIHEAALPHFRERTADLAEQYVNRDYDGMAEIAMEVESLNALDADTIIERYLVPGENLDIPNPDVPAADGSAPGLLTLSPHALMLRLRQAYHASRLTLILSNLKLEDAVELLYDGKGMITHLEIFNLKTMTDLQVLRRKPVSRLQRAINDQNAVTLKKMIHACIDLVGLAGYADADDRIEKLTEILNNFDLLRSYYKNKPLKTKIGSGSTGSSSRTHGMGFAVVETLPLRTQREIATRRDKNCLPVFADVTQTVEYVQPARGRGRFAALLRRMGRVPGLRNLICRRKNSWINYGYQVEEATCGNVITLGGAPLEADNGLRLHHEVTPRPARPPLTYLNSDLKNWLKVLAGFVPAFLTFYLTKEWWVLAYLGGLIWFSITGVRNVIQAVLGGGGLRRSPSLRWNDFVSWDRISDSLFYTGFSVPLLDWLCKSMLLDKGLNITTATNPILLYTIMAVTNGVYICSHNLFRGLPKEAALANLFRSVLSIPIAIALNFVIGLVLAGFGVTDIAAQLQLWAAVISKLASDCIAAIIEGFADRRHNIAMRHWDYSEKVKQVFEVFSQMEVRFPTRDMLATLNDPESFIELTQRSEQSFLSIVITNALDLLYFKMYQPRAAEALRQAIDGMTRDELDVFLASQRILTREREVSRLFVEGLVGQNFSAPLSFYLIRYKGYLRDLDRLSARTAGN